ncbi:hypothetical protein Bca4012_060756 [Brassica carinata]|uniref:Exocyst subunit Exo70 family protein n=1 Tax=Brassica carinata TaxID=52824 RepID=A0A8X7SA26_BRACI|nr:hypothetical protein Bca52824_031103 [Brassica carinata]
MLLQGTPELCNCSCTGNGKPLFLHPSLSCWGTRPMLTVARAEWLWSIQVTSWMGNSSHVVHVQAYEIQTRLAEVARGILSEFENAVLREPSVVPVHRGTVHPLTRYVMNYISLISDYKQTLNDLIMSDPSARTDPNTLVMDFTELEDKSPWLCILYEKSHHYRDTSLAHIFIMNIFQKVKGSPKLREMIGDHYLRKLTGSY